MLLIFLFIESAGSKIIFNFYLQLSGSLFLSLLIIAHFIMQVNIHYCFDWPMLADSKTSLEDLAECHPKKTAIPIYFISVYNNYYKVVDTAIAKIPLVIIDEDKLAMEGAGELKEFMQYDYAIVTPILFNKIKQAGVECTVIKSYELTGDKLIGFNGK
jgi:hypothetical protein